MSSARRVLAVLTAAGSGTRLGCDGPKALVPVGSTPMVVLAARGLAEGGVDRVVVTAPESDMDAFHDLFPDGVCPGHEGVAVRVVAGSPLSRQASVKNGLDALAEDDSDLADSVILVHDAARPLTPASVTARVIAAVRAGHDAVIPAMPVTDTLKQVDQSPADGASSLVLVTPDRSRLVSVQTPQGFQGRVLLKAHHDAEARGSNETTAATDDAGLVEAAGGQVHVVLGSADSLKVTTTVDLALAEMLSPAR
ncbi:2-C-methyl-D-erythritol 4-phosphate cytidylyltransferase [Schaalia sp. 19OD2882]|uniref:IspD/TarI family cytidylyltransferase n=1 Tax=Schaalia sp. 19OD2882 TaxID=2794089 RepID=UPI001C1EFDAA|nr:IspD/TarI family cytidylyltransferase [Schaalia sp. 19OD2882]QWW19787.1 2-C-methyl-D-erythritol 4-phosphate cytidylyltransferase [Schaalia sp. 19OD2882]